MLNLISERQLAETEDLEAIQGEHNLSGESVNKLLNDQGVLDLASQLELMAEYLGTDVIDITSAVIQRDSTDYQLERISRSDFFYIPKKSTEARPTQFFLERHITPRLYYYPTPENSTDVIYYYALSRMQDAGDYTNNMETVFRFLPCMTAGLAYYLAIKRAPDRVVNLKAIYDEEFDRAAFEDIDSVSSRFLPPRQVI